MSSLHIPFDPIFVAWRVEYLIPYTQWDAQGRDVHKLVEAISGTPIREINIDISEGRGWGGFLVSIMILLLGGFTYFAYDMFTNSTGSVQEVAYQQREIPIVQSDKVIEVETVPEGGVVSLNKIAYGVRYPSS